MSQKYISQLHAYTITHAHITHTYSLFVYENDKKNERCSVAELHMQIDSLVTVMNAEPKVCQRLFDQKFNTNT